MYMIESLNNNLQGLLKKLDESNLMCKTIKLDNDKKFYSINRELKLIDTKIQSLTNKLTS